MGSEGQIYICCENAEGKENFTCLKTSNETSINLILTSSTLKHVWNYETEDKTECLIECLPGAKIDDFIMTFNTKYKFLPYRLNVVVVGGINDIAHAETADKILEKMTILKREIQNHGIRFQFSKPNTVMFCQLFYPPRYCELNCNISELYQKVECRSRYRTLQIYKLNKYLLTMNNADNLPTESFLATYGLTYPWKTQYDDELEYHTVNHIPDPHNLIWKEHQWNRKLQMSVSGKMTMLEKILQYFQNLKQ